MGDTVGFNVRAPARRSKPAVPVAVGLALAATDGATTSGAPQLTRALGVGLMGHETERPAWRDLILTCAANGNRWQPTATILADLGCTRLRGYSRGIGQPVNKGAVTTMAAETPTIVFVHGAWADATGFGEVIRALRGRGFAASGWPTRSAT
jgi:hypothetical protein